MHHIVSGAHNSHLEVVVEKAVTGSAIAYPSSLKSFKVFYSQLFLRLSGGYKHSLAI